MQMLFVLPLLEGGNAGRFFSFCVFCAWFGVFCRFFAVLLFLGSLFEKIFGSELLFLGVVVGLVFFDSVLPRFLFYNLVFRSRKCLGKILFMSGLLFLGVCSFSLWFSVVVAFFCFFVFFKRESSGLTGHTPTRTLCSCFFFLFLSPPHRVYLPFWPCVLPFSRFVGVPFWAPGVFWILLGLL